MDWLVDVASMQSFLAFGEISVAFGPPLIKQDRSSGSDPDELGFRRAAGTLPGGGKPLEGYSVVISRVVDIAA